MERKYICTYEGKGIKAIEVVSAKNKEEAKEKILDANPDITVTSVVLGHTSKNEE